VDGDVSGLSITRVIHPDQPGQRPPLRPEPASYLVNAASTAAPEVP
jgi:hypothetical protein